MNQIQIPEGHVIDPMLLEVVARISLDRPMWVFKAVRATKNSATPQSFDEPLRPRDRKESAESARYLRKIAVTEANQRLGSIAIEYGYTGRFSGEYYYALSSWRISKERGERNVKRTAKAETALRELRKSFVAKSYREVWEETTGAIHTGFRDAAYEFTTEMARQIQSIDDARLAVFVHNTLIQQPIPTALETSLRDIVMTDKFAKVRANYELAGRMREHATKQNFVFVVEHDGGFLYGDDHDIVNVSFNLLPSQVQDHVAVLQLVDDGEMVLDVGYRRAPGQYMVCKPNA